MSNKDNPREVIVKILSEWQKSGQKIDTVRDNFLTPDTELEKRDRGFITEVTYGVVRNLSALDSELDELVTADLKRCSTVYSLF